MMLLQLRSGMICLLWGATLSSNFQYVVSGCINSLTDLAHLMDQQDTSIHNTYELCANTVFEVGFPDEAGHCCVDGQSAIYPRSKTTIKCGPDGSSANNCTVTSGQYQLLAIEPNYYETLINSKIQGVTFHKGGNAGLLLAQAGEMTFEDCIIKDHAHTGPVSLLYSGLMSTDGSRRSLRGTSDEALRWRLAAEYTALLEGKEPSDGLLAAQRDQRMLKKDSTRQKVNFINCLFEGNFQGNASEVTQSGVISADSALNDLYVDGCIFTKNIFDEPPQGYAISARNGSTVEIYNSCFYDNDFLGNGTVEVLDGGFFNYSNNYGESSDDVVCDFLAEIPDDSKPICHGYDAKSCPA